MKRNLKALASSEYDVLVVGGGIYGAATARDAALRGLKTAIIEKSDFCSATSANSLKIIHGGLRYLQQLDIPRLRESVRERRNMMRIAPHIVHPLPCAMPTCGMLMKSRLAMFLGMLANNVLSLDRNSLADPEKLIPNGHLVSKKTWQDIAPDLDLDFFTGAAVWNDAYAYNTERLVSAMVKGAVDAGAEAANYLELTDFMKQNDKVCGITARDILGGENLSIRAKLVINNTGPWINETLKLLGSGISVPSVELAVGVNVIVKKQLNRHYSLGLSSSNAADAGDSRLYFFMPWHDELLAGTYYRKHTGSPSSAKVDRKDLDILLNDLNNAYPGANLKMENILHVHVGVLPAWGTYANGEPKLLHHYKLVDHSQTDRLDGIITALGVKYTTARDVAEKTVDLAMKKLKKDFVHAKSAETPVPGGAISDFVQYRKNLKDEFNLSDRIVDHLIMNYGSECTRIMELSDKQSDLLNPLYDDTCVSKAEILFAIRDEMAERLSDVVIRRTDLGFKGCPDDDALLACARIMADEKEWDSVRIKEEIESTKKYYNACIQ